jgi:fatty-acyl-CoA synthase
VWADNIPEWVVLELAAGLAGITIVTVNPALRGEELAHVPGQSRAGGIFLVPEYRGTDMIGMLDALRGRLPLLREVVSFADWDTFCASGPPAERLPDVDPRDAAQIQYTSGTTGRPKGAVLHHRGIVNNARLCADRLALAPGSVQLSPMPLFHTAGCVVSVLGALAGESTLVLPPFFDAGLVLELIEAERAEALLAVPTMLIGILDHPRFATTDVSCVRCVVTGGAVVSPDEDVADVAVLGVLDPTWGEQVAAFVRPAAGHTPDPEALFAYCRDRLAPHKTPRHWRIVDAFPLTPSGKVQKYVLRERFLAASDPAPAGAPAAGANTIAGT